MASKMSSTDPLPAMAWYLPRFHVVVAQGLCLRVIYFQTVGYGLRVVVGSSGLLSAFDHAVDQFVVGYFESDNGVELRSALLQQFVECFGLRYCAWESVEYYSVGGFRVVFDDVGEYADHQLVGYELAFVDVFFGGFAELGSFGDMAAEHFAGGDMVYAVTFDEFCALRPFAACRVRRILRCLNI